MASPGRNRWGTDNHVPGLTPRRLSSADRVRACAAGHVPLKRMDRRSQIACLGKCQELLKQGASVLFFPEGTRSLTPRMGDFKKGAFSVAAKAKVAPLRLPSPLLTRGSGNAWQLSGCWAMQHGEVLHEAQQGQEVCPGNLHLPCCTPGVDC